jgi:AbrB family looped-hinge helix DNA binding protein
METTLSTKGQIVLPEKLRNKLGLGAGDKFDIEVRTGRVVLTPRKRRVRKGRIVVDKLTGLPVLTAGPGAPTLTSKQVEEMLADFP